MTTYHDPNPVVVYTTTQDTITVTPSASTLSLTNYQTVAITNTLPATTDSLTVTSTITTTATVTANTPVVTKTITASVSVTSTSTTTVAPPAGFTPILESINNQHQKRDAIDPGSVCSADPEDKYATSVDCVVSFTARTSTTSTVTEPAATVTAVEPTSTVTVTGTITSTSVFVPPDKTMVIHVSKTTTTTSTSTPPPTTLLVTSTKTLSVTTTTSFYAACASNNIIGMGPLSSSDYGPYAGKYLDGFQVPLGIKKSAVYASSAYDCCVACQLTPNCISSSFMPTFGSQDCYIETASSCDRSSNAVWLYLQSQSTANWGVSGGPCGSIYVATVD